MMFIEAALLAVGVVGSIGGLFGWAIGASFTPEYERRGLDPTEHLKFVAFHRWLFIFSVACGLIFIGIRYYGVLQ